MDDEALAIALMCADNDMAAEQFLKQQAELSQQTEATVTSPPASSSGGNHTPSPQTVHSLFQYLSFDR